MKNGSSGAVLGLSIPLTLLVAGVSLAGLQFQEMYAKETGNWQTQAEVQDAVDLFLMVPVLVATALYAFRGYTTAWLVWGGVNVYLVYTFTIYCFSVHFNMLFPAYCLILGLSFYSVVYFLYAEVKEPTIRSFLNERPVQITWVYFLGVAFLFYVVWLADIIPAIRLGTVPASVTEAGLLTNPVQVIDLSVFLPGVILTAIFLKRRTRLALQLAPVLLTFFFFMDITIVSILVVMHTRGIQQNFMVILAMSLLAFLSSLLLSWYIRSSMDR